MPRSDRERVQEAREPDSAQRASLKAQQTFASEAMDLARGKPVKLPPCFPGVPIRDGRTIIGCSADFSTNDIQFKGKTYHMDWSKWGPIEGFSNGPDNTPYRKRGLDVIP